MQRAKVVEKRACSNRGLHHPKSSGAASAISDCPSGADTGQRRSGLYPLSYCNRWQ